MKSDLFLAHSVDGCISEDPAVDRWPMNEPHLELDPCSGGDKARCCAADNSSGQLPTRTQGSSGHMRKQISTSAWCGFILCSLAFVLSPSSSARELVSLTNELRIVRDFTPIVIDGSTAKSARVFVDTDRFAVVSLSPSENAKLQHSVVDALGSKVQVVKSKEEANYLVQIRMEQFSNYSIRNPRGEHSRGIVMFSICGFPIKDNSDCENLNYFYFREYKAEEIFHKVLLMWLETVFPSGELR
jgi:hypothetical protein